MKLTDTQIKNAKPKDKQYKLFDGAGLFLLVTPSGGKLWRFKYRFGGKEKLMAMGAYPEISLAEARRCLQDARKTHAEGTDPGEAKKQEKITLVTFKEIAEEWHERFFSTWTPGHAKTIKSRLERDVFPYIGSTPIIEVTPPMILKVLRRIESRGALETAHRIRSLCGQVFRYAISTGRAERDSAADLRGALPPVKSKHLASITDPDRVADLLRAIDGYQGTHTVKSALRLAPLVFVRPGELRHAEWSEIDFEKAEWNIPAEKMKTRDPHLVPLCNQAVEILNDLKPLTGAGRYVFPSPKTKARPMSDNAVLSALRSLGYEKAEMSGHGFRAMARTILDEVLQFRPDIIEHQLAHAVKDPLGRAYNRTKHLDERRKMMQKWADYLDELKEEAKVIPLRKI